MIAIVIVTAAYVTFGIAGHSYVNRWICHGLDDGNESGTGLSCLHILNPIMVVVGARMMLDKLSS
jgi:hypothetical protein